MATARDIIENAMRKAGILTKNEAMAADEAQDGLEMLNDLLASYSNDSMTVYARTLETFTLSAGDTTYTIGSGGDFNTTRPIKVISAYVRSGGIDYPLELLSDENYAAVTLKTSGGIPAYINFTNGFPLATLNIFPAPSSSYSIFLLTEKQLTNIASLNTTIDFPPGWNRMLTYNLAKELAPEYGVDLPAGVLEIANESRQNVRHAIMVAKKMQWDSGVNGLNNIYSGYNN